MRHKIPGGGQEMLSVTGSLGTLHTKNGFENCVSCCDFFTPKLIYGDKVLGKDWDFFHIMYKRKW